MSEAKSSIDASDQEDIVVYGMKGEMSVVDFEVSCCSTTSLHLRVSGNVSPGFEIGWVSQVTIRLYHRYILVGEITCPHEPIIPSSDNNVEINWEKTNEFEMHIKNMMGWMHFFEDFMSKVGTSHVPNNEDWPMAALGVSASGHRLIMSIDLAGMLRMSAVVESLKLSGDWLKIVITTDNQSPFMLDFDGNCRFVLEKERHHLGYFDGKLCISYGETRFVFRGRYIGRASGMATLKGDRFISSDKKASWLQYALRLFKVEINLDEIAVKPKNKGE